MRDQLSDIRHISKYGEDPEVYLIGPDGERVLDKQGNPIKASALQYLGSSSSSSGSSLGNNQRGRSTGKRGKNGKGRKGKGSKNRKGRRRHNKAKGESQSRYGEPHSALIDPNELTDDQSQVIAIDELQSRSSSAPHAEIKKPPKKKKGKKKRKNSIST